MFPLRNSKLNDFFEQVYAPGEATWYDLSRKYYDNTLSAVKPFMISNKKGRLTVCQLFLGPLPRGNSSIFLK